MVVTREYALPGEASVMLPGGAGGIGVALLPDGRLRLWVSTEDGRLWSALMKDRDPASWSPWEEFEAGGEMLPGAAREISAAPLSDGRLQLCVSADDGKLYTSYMTAQDPSSPWARWGELRDAGSRPLPGAARGVAAAPLSDGRLQVLVTAEDGKLYTTWKETPDPNSLWAPWGELRDAGSRPLPGAARGVAAAPLSDGRLQVLVTAEDGKLYTTWKETPDPNSLWARWEGLRPIEMTSAGGDGVIDYPLYPGQSLTGAWSVTPNPTGPSVAPGDGYLHYWVTDQPAENQWLLVSTTAPLSTEGGLILTFAVRANTIQGQEVKFTIAAGLILRFTRDQVAWQRWDGTSFRTLASSGVRADGVWRQVTLSLTPGQVSLFEDGSYLFTWETGVGASIRLPFLMQVWDKGASLSFDIGGIYASQSTFAPGVDTPWDYAFRDQITPPSEAIRFRAPADGIQPSFHEGFVRFDTPALRTADGSCFLDVLQPAATASVLSYRLRVNSSGGPETTITLPGGNILRLTGNGTSAAWVAWEGSFRQLASSGIVAGQLDFTVVTLVTSAASVTLFENGVFKYRRGYGPPVTTWAPGIAVQHRGSGTAVSVDLGGIRVLPSIKPSMLLAMDLQPRLLAYFPLKSDLDNASGNGGTLTAVGGSPSFGPGRFGHAAIFTPRGPVLAIPPLSRAVSASYTISAWVKVNAYPADGSTAGIAGFLLLGSDGKLDYRFLYNLDRVYRGVRVPSRQRVSAGTWHNVVVTYSYEEARLAIFIDGNLDTLSYLGADVASASAIIPAAGYVGGYRETFNSPIVGLDGAVGDVVFLSQHVHQPTAAMLANVNSAVTDGPELPVLIPLFLILMAGVVRVGIEEAILRQVQPAPPPSLEELVRRIRSRVGVPARQGARVSRADLGINDDYPILLDIGGEGPLDVGGLVTGFSGAININALMTGTGTPVVTVAFGESRGAPIPLLVQLAAWDTDPHPRYPFTDKFADQITMIGSPLLDVHVAEMARVIKVGGEINLWVDKSWGANVERLAQALNSQVETPEDIPRFANNGVPENQEGGTWYVRKRIIARR